MKITRENYESYFIDWLEGTLPDNKIAEFELFIKQNPDLKNELDDFEEIKLKDNENKAFNVNLLKEIPSKLFFDISEEEYKSIALLEGDIHEKTSKTTENKEYSKRFSEIYNQISFTKLVADESIFFPLKNRIKRTFISARIKKSIYTIASIAAILLIYFSVRNTKSNNENLKNQPPFIASIDTLKQNKISKISDDKVFVVSVLQKNKVERNYKRKQVETISENEKLPEKHYISDENKTELIASNSNFELPEKAKNILEVKNSIDISLKISTLDETTKLPYMKNKFWEYTEKAVVVWKKMTESELELNNIYHKSGKLNKLNIYAGNIKFSKTFN